jgi:hypothetical protein
MPHVAQDTNGRTTRHSAYAISLRIRKRIEETLRMGQNGGRTTQAAPSRAAQGGLAVHTGNGSLQ